jgi:hypothetical protein
LRNFLLIVVGELEHTPGLIALRLGAIGGQQSELGEVGIGGSGSNAPVHGGLQEIEAG